MIDIVFEVIFEIITDTSFGVVFDKKYPVALRIIAGLVLLVVFGALTVVPICVGLWKGNIVLLCIGVFISALAIIAVIVNKKKRR